MTTATIAIPVYNSAATLARCLASAARQTLSDIEILVTDDASTDASAAIVRGWAREDPRIRLIGLPTNGGKARAMNLMLEQARGDWFAVLDADDAYQPDRLRWLIGGAMAAGVEMAADNLVYVDAGLGDGGRAVGTAFAEGSPARLIGKNDLPAHSSSVARFDFGLLKPVIRRDFALAHELEYLPDTKLAEDFYYLMECLVAGARLWLCGEPLYYWTMPFGPISRRWTGTGSGAWRYDYRNALAANDVFIARMAASGEPAMVRMLRARATQYTTMVHYLDAQRSAAEGRRLAAVRGILAHPCTYSLLLRRLWGRAARALPGRLAGNAA